MSSEDFAFKVKRYRDKENNPTCAIDFQTGEICIFYRTQRFGCNETCVFAVDRGNYYQTMQRRKKGEGTLIPLKQCPIWEGNQ